MGRVKYPKGDKPTIVAHGLRYAKIFYNIPNRYIKRYMTMNIKTFKEKAKKDGMCDDFINRVLRGIKLYRDRKE